MLSDFSKNRVFAGIFLGFVISLLVLPGIFTGTFKKLHYQFSDSLFTRNEPSNEIVIIALDDKSTQPQPEGLGRFNQWTRDNFTELLNILNESKPKVIAFDLVFHTPTTSVPQEKLLELEQEVSTLENPTDQNEIYQKFVKDYKNSLTHPIDIELALKFQETPNLVLAALQDGDTLISPLRQFKVNAKLGIINAFFDDSGILRQAVPHFTANGEKFKDFGLTISELYLDKEIDVPTENGQLNVNFFGDPYSFKMISFVDVLNGKFSPEDFQNKIVLIGGTSSKEFHDEFYTPRSNTTPMPGVEFRANEIQTILEGKFLSNQSAFSQFLSVLALATVAAIAFNYLGIIFSLILAAALIITYIFLAHFFYKKGLILNMVYPFIAITLAYISSWIYKYFITDRKKRELKHAFGRYVSDKLVDEISKNPDIVKLGGEKRVVTALFSDIKDSTKISEKVDISSWVAQVNEYFTVMESIIQKYDGTLDKYEGDAIMAFWNAPVVREDHTFLAYAAALEMQKALKELHLKWQTEGRPLIEIRIGINTGEAIVGNFGSANRFDYTVMGDTVNTASRLESSANKTYGTSIMVAGFEGQPKLENFILRELDTVYLPGKKVPVKLFELSGLATESEKKQLAEQYSSALNFYRAKNWPQAIPVFQNLKDSASVILLNRCQILQSGGKISELSDEMIFSILNK